jgi:hypothetical protein
MIIKGGYHMAGVLYAKDGKIYNNCYMEIYIPLDYFDVAGGYKFAVNKGSAIETIGLVYTRAYENGVEGPIKLLNIPAILNIMIYDFQQEEIKINGKPMTVVTLKFLKDSYVLHQTVQKGRELAEAFINYMLMGKLPRTLNYAKIIDIWWRNLEMSGVTFKVPSKIYEMIIANIYRNPANVKQRYGEYYGKQSNPSGTDYKTGNVRDVVEGLSTFSGMVFEDISRMITSGINNSLDGVEEPVSPLEKVIYY